MCMMNEIRAKQDEIHAIARWHRTEMLWGLGVFAQGMNYPTAMRICSPNGLQANILYPYAFKKNGVTC